MIAENVAQWKRAAEGQRSN